MFWHTIGRRVRQRANQQFDSQRQKVQEQSCENFGQLGIERDPQTQERLSKIPQTFYRQKKTLFFISIFFRNISFFLLVLNLATLIFSTFLFNFV